MRALLFAAALTSSAAAAGAAGPDPGRVVFSITSPSPGTAFSAACRLVKDGVESVEDHSGTAPVVLTFEADRVRCEFSSVGPIKVDARDPRGNRTLSSNPGGRIVISI